jgi:hypothetical protein
MEIRMGANPIQEIIGGVSKEAVVGPYPVSGIGEKILLGASFDDWGLDTPGWIGSGSRKGNGPAGDHGSAFLPAQDQGIAGQAGVQKGDSEPERTASTAAWISAVKAVVTSSPPFNLGCLALPFAGRRVRGVVPDSYMRVACSR